jgi:hypothetical protein
MILDYAKSAKPIEPVLVGSIDGYGDSWKLLFFASRQFIGIWINS